MSKTLNETERVEALKKIGLDADAPGLVAVVAATDPKAPMLAPEGVDPRTMAISDIVFEATLLEEFNLDDADERNRATRKVFDLYKSYGRNTDRNRRLQDEVGNFIRRVRVSRKGGIPVEHIKDKVRQTKEQRDLLQGLAALGITSLEDIAALTKEKS